MSSRSKNSQICDHELQKEIALWELPLSPEELNAMRGVRADKDPEIGEDQGIGNNVSNDGSSLRDLPENLKKFGSWLGVAATINRKAYQVSKFDPASPTFDEDSWYSYNNKFKSLPFWLYVTHKQRDAAITELSLSPLIDAVANLFEEIVTESSLNDIKTSIKKIAELAVNNREQSQKDTYEQNGLISIKNGELYFANTRTIVEFTYHEGKGYQQLKQTLNVRTTLGKLDLDKVARSADKILSWDETDVDAWETATGSNPLPPNESPAWNN